MENVIKINLRMRIKSERNEDKMNQTNKTIRTKRREQKTTAIVAHESEIRTKLTVSYVGSTGQGSTGQRVWSIEHSAQLSNMPFHRHSFVRALRLIPLHPKLELGRATEHARYAPALCLHPTDPRCTCGTHTNPA